MHANHIDVVGMHACMSSCMCGSLSRFCFHLYYLCYAQKLTVAGFEIEGVSIAGQVSWDVHASSSKDAIA